MKLPSYDEGPTYLGFVYVNVCLEDINSRSDYYSSTFAFQKSWVYGGGGGELLLITVKKKFFHRLICKRNDQGKMLFCRGNVIEISGNFEWTQKWLSCNIFGHLSAKDRARLSSCARVCVCLCV